MDFLGALGRDCTAESDPAPRPLPPARPAASVPVAPPASADQIRRRFEHQRRELAPRGGRSSSPREPPRAVSVARSGAEAVAHLERSHRRRSSAARDDKRESRRDDPPSPMERVLKRLDGVEKALHRSRAGSSSQSASPAAPVVPLAALLPHNPVGSPARSDHPPPAGTGFVGAGGGPPWARFVPPSPLPAPRDLAVSSRRARASALLPPMKEVPTAILAHLWSLAESLQSLERILQESYDSMPVSPPSRFSQKPRADCHAAASALFALVTPLQVAPSPGATSASQLADSALALKTLVGGSGTPVDVVGATVLVVRLLWLNASGMLAAVEAHRM
ncbi:unnamed protein product [Closterium sp. Naga37s-1]|nr:unnamed protein product [Closterium sp. Naga37s-1]